MADLEVYRAQHRFARISAQKVRPVARLLRGFSVDEALNLLRYRPERGAALLEKVVKSALGNAEDRRCPDLKSLMVLEVRIDGGPMMKRMKPGSRGVASVILKRMSHITVELA